MNDAWDTGGTDNDYEVLLQKQSGTVSNLKLDFNLVDQDVEENVNQYCFLLYIIV